MTARQAKRLSYEVFVALVVGTLAAFATLVFLVSLAHAQEAQVAWVPPAPAGFDVTALLTAIAAVTGIVLFLRGIFRKWLAPEPATELSKAVSMLVAVLAGLAVGYGGLAGGGTLAERLTLGFIAATAATFGRDFAVRSWRVPAERREAKAADVPAPPETP